MFPQATAGPIFHDHMRRGKFHGIIWATTPICRTVSLGLHLPVVYCGAHRLLFGIVESLRVGLNDLALDLVCPSTVVSQAPSAHANIHLGYAESLAIV